MKTEQINIDQPDTITLSHIIEPLAQALQELTQHPRDEIEVVLSTFEGQESRSHEAYIALDLHAETPDRLLRALWTILEGSDSCVRWLNFAGPDPQNPFSGPIAFALVQQRYGSGEFDLHSYLWAYCRNEAFDVEAAKAQIANLVDLVGLIDNTDNLDELPPRHRVRL
jgi:hypothetical protein